MSDRSSASLYIGGNLEKDRVGELARLLDDTFPRPDGHVSFEGLVRQASADGDILAFDEDGCEYGFFGIEKQLVDLGVSYDRSYKAGCDYSEGQECYRPGMSETRGFPSNGGEVVLAASIARQVIELIVSGRNAEAATALGVAIGDDIPKLQPLRIV